jgi:hypothetical protein
MCRFYGVVNIILMIAGPEKGTYRILTVGKNKLCAVFISTQKIFDMVLYLLPEYAFSTIKIRKSQRIFSSLLGQQIKQNKLLRQISAKQDL